VATGGRRTALRGDRSERAASALLALVALALSACTVGPDFATPPTTVGSSWIEAGDPRVSTKPADPTWWKALDDPTLDRLIDTAHRQNLTLHRAAVRVLQAQAQLGVAIGDLYPQQQQAGGKLTYVNVSRRDPWLTRFGDNTFWLGQVGVSAAWEIDFWGKIRRAIESADAGLTAGVADYDNALVTLLADVASTYVNVRTYEERLRIVRDNVKLQESSLAVAQARFREGETGERDVEQAKSELAETEAQAPQLKIQLQQARNALSVLLGLPPSQLGDLLGPAGPIPQAPLEVAVGIPADLLRRRPDVRSAEENAAAESAKIGATKAELYPAFSLSGTFGFRSSDSGSFAVSDIAEWSSRSFSFGPAFKWSLLNYGQITNQVRAQDAVFQEAVLAYQEQVLDAQREVEDALVAFLQAQEAVDYLTRAVAASRRSADLAMVQYRAGQTDYTTVLTAEQALLRQQEQLAVARGDIPQGLVSVYRALGGGWQIREGKPLVPAEIKAEMAKRTDWGKLLELDDGGPPAPVPPLPPPEF
jgi:NodT family efflux transporter outer membrane factor (OMF) lipoprotein